MRCVTRGSSVSIEVARENGLCRLVVEDDGEGIPEADRASVFRAFTRLDTSRNRETGGFGLGLAIVARIAALHRRTRRAPNPAPASAARDSILEWPDRGFSAARSSRAASAASLAKRGIAAQCLPQPCCTHSSGLDVTRKMYAAHHPLAREFRGTGLERQASLGYQLGEQMAHRIPIVCVSAWIGQVTLHVADARL